jgi:malic enzyme
MNVQEVETTALSIPERAKLVIITTAAEYISAGELLKTIKGLSAEIDETFDPIIKAAHSAHKEAILQKNKVAAPLLEAEGLLKPRIASYLREEERKRQAEEMRLQKEARDREEAEQLAKADILHEIGEVEMANEVLKEEIYVPPVVLPSAAPKVAGISMRETWSASVVNLMDLVKAVASGKAPIQCIQANSVFLGQQARAMKAALSYPGVRAVSDSNISAGRR